MLGASYKMWMKKQADGDPQKMKDWSLSQNIPLSVYLMIDGEWVFQDYYNTVGPMAFKKDVLSLDLSEIEDGPLQIKLQSGSYFWELGYAGLSLDEEMEIHMEILPLHSGIDEEDQDIREALLSDDELYYVQPEIGNEANLVFKAPQMEAKDRTLVLHSKGYYQIKQDSKGAPKLKALKEIRKSGNFNAYSNELMQEMLAEHIFRDGKAEKRGK
jgi:hypothetical protein